MIEGVIGLAVTLGAFAVATRALWPWLRPERPRADHAKIHALEYAMFMRDDAPDTALPHERYMLEYRQRLEREAGL